LAPTVQYNARKLAGRFCKGLIAEVEKLGPGTWMDDAARPSWVRRGNDICRATFALRYVFQDKHLLRMSFSHELRKGTWHCYHYALHFGPDPWDERSTLFRCDRDDFSGDHVHLAPNSEIHIPAAEVIPDASAMDPICFVKLVGEYRKTKAMPFARKSQ
jgi:hypothetical protein